MEYRNVDLSLSVISTVISMAYPTYILLCGLFIRNWISRLLIAERYFKEDSTGGSCALTEKFGLSVASKPVARIAAEKIDNFVCRVV